MQSYILTAATWCNRDSPSYMQSLPFSKDKDHAPRVLLGAKCYPSSHPSTSFIYHCFESQISISQGVCSPQSMLIQDKFQPWTWVLLNLETNISNLVFIHLFFFFLKQRRNYSLIKGWGRENLCSEDSFLFIHLDTKFKKHFPSILCSGMPGACRHSFSIFSACLVYSEPSVSCSISLSSLSWEDKGQLVFGTQCRTQQWTLYSSIQWHLIPHTVQWNHPSWLCHPMLPPRKTMKLEKQF